MTSKNFNKIIDEMAKLIDTPEAKAAYAKEMRKRLKNL